MTGMFRSFKLERLESRQLLAGDPIESDSAILNAAGDSTALDAADFSAVGSSTKVGTLNNATIAGRQVFYNRAKSSIFGDGSGNPIGVIDSTKSVLLPGGTATTANYSNYLKGINGLIVDINGLMGNVSAADFQFATWDGIAAGGFATSSAVPTITVIAGGGVGGTSRVKIEFPDNAIRNTWLRVTVLANANTGLSATDVFYFGNAVGDMNAGNSGTPFTIRTDDADVAAVRQNQSIDKNSVGITNFYDIDKDGRVTANDTGYVRQNLQPGNIIAFFTAPAVVTLPPAVTSQSETTTTETEKFCVSPSSAEVVRFKRLIGTYAAKDSAPHFPFYGPIQPEKLAKAPIVLNELRLTEADRVPMGFNNDWYFARYQLPAIEKVGEDKRG